MNELKIPIDGKETEINVMQIKIDKIKLDELM